MKLKSILKAILSFFIWGLGQLLNRQYLKALFFFAVFVLFIGIELGTSKYFYKEDYEHQLAYEKISGNNFDDEWYHHLLGYYVKQFRENNKTYPAFEEYLVLNDVSIIEIGSGRFTWSGEENITEASFIEWLASDIEKTSPETYTNIITDDVIEKDEFLNNIVDYKLLKTKEIIYYDEDNDIYYYENIGRSIEEEEREYIETNFFTEKENPAIINNVTGFLKYEKSGEIYQYNEKYYLKVKVNGDDKLALLNLDVLSFIDYPTTPPLAVQKNIYGPLYGKGDDFFEHYRPGLIHNGVRLQYKETDFMKMFRTAMVTTFNLPGNEFDGTDYTKLMIKVYFGLNPEVREDFLDGYDHFFYDRAGLFTRGYWAVSTLGITKKVDYRSFHALDDIMIGTEKDGVSSSLKGLIAISPSVPLQGHVSTMLLLEGLIGVILSLFFFIFLFWSVKDAYVTSNRKIKKEEIESDRKYFKNIWDKSFEYIVLSPALFVLAFISIMPIAFGFIIAFTNISGNESMMDTFDWVGLKNFVKIFNFASGLGDSFGRAFWRVLSWTVVWAVFSTFTVFFGGFIQALILNSEKVVFRKLWRTILILPWAIPALLSQMVFSVMFKEKGVVNQLLNSIGISDILKNIGILGKPYHSLSKVAQFFYLGPENIQWFSNPHNATFVRATLIVVNIWLGFPYFMALMTGVMTAIDKTLYEAADIDGATGFQKITKITMPLVLYSTAPILIMTFSGNFNNFGVIYFITGGGPNTGSPHRGFAGDTDILISWMYKLTVDYSVYNMASVFSVLIFFFVGSITAWNLSRTRAFQED